MVFLFFLLSFSSIAYAMEGSIQIKNPLRVAIDTADYQTTLQLLKAGAEVNTPDKQGAYVLHWAVLKTLSLSRHPQWQSNIEDRMQLVDALLVHGADYRCQERDSKRTILHILALHLSRMDSNDVVLFALDRLLKGMCKADLKKVSDVGAQLPQDVFVGRMSELCKRKNNLNQSVIDIATHKKCVSFFDEERFKRAYESACEENNEL